MKQNLPQKAFVKDGCMITASGKIFDLMAPNGELIDIFDIAHQLSNICRWGAASARFYSVAEHCIWMAEKAPEHLKAVALMHDCEEAYWGDIIKPIKKLLPLSFQQKMHKLRNMIFAKFGLDARDCDCTVIKNLDWEALQWEYECLMVNRSYQPLSPEKARDRFLCVFTDLLLHKYIKIK